MVSWSSKRFLICCVLVVGVFSQFLKVDKASKLFTYDSSRVFLNGVNQAWVNYGNDFGNNQTNGDYCQLRGTLQNETLAGGHAMRIWLFVEGDNIPLWDNQGNVIGTDKANSLIDDMRHYLWTAQDQGILVFWCLWNGAVLRDQNTINMIKNPAKIQTFIDNALVPMVKALANEPAVGGWELMNEPEGSVSIGSDPNPCFDTNILRGSGAGWAGTNIAMKDLLNFFNLQADAIHRADPKALVTVGSWSERAITDDFGYRNYYKDECLIAAGGKPNGILDFYEVHSYAFNGQFGTHAPFKQNSEDYHLDKPLIVGEFNSQSGAGMSSAQLYTYVYEHGYQGAWGWTAEPQDGNFAGMAALKGRPYVDLKLPKAPYFPDTCDCSDVPPPGGYTCIQQSSWGKCDQSWMKGYCCKSCFKCQACK